jgi:hypothetical protein
VALQNLIGVAGLLKLSDAPAWRRALNESG